MTRKPTKGKSVGDEATTRSGGEDLPERWSAQRKTELVLRLLRGEPLDAVSRESQVPAHELARRVIAEFIERYNREWLIERLDYRTPAQARAAGWRAAA